MQFGRYETKTHNILPQEWTEELTKTLTHVYTDQLEKDHRFFDVYGEICDKEFVVVISYLHLEDQLNSPISLFISHDIVEDSKAFKKTLKNLVDLSGEQFDDILSIQDWSDYVPNWTENSYKNSHFFYKITRENISLTLQAEEILSKDALNKIR